MRCANCDKSFKTGRGAYVMRDGQPVAITFCCYKCYLEFWKGVKNHEPLPEYKGEAIRIIFTKTFVCPHCDLIKELQHGKYQRHYCPDCKKKKREIRMKQIN